MSKPRLDPSIFAADNWYGVTLREALPYIQQPIVQYLGIFPIKGGERPQTDGKQIILSSRIAKFKDSKKDLLQNRNISLYISDGNHEMLHIREGSFLVNIKESMKQYKNQSLAHNIMNIVDDGRIEHNGLAYLSNNHIELMRNSNRYLLRQIDYPQHLAMQALEIFSAQIIVKATPAQVNPLLIDAQKETLQTEINSAALNKKGINRVGDLVERIVSLGEKSFGHSAQLVHAVVPEIYTLLTQAFPKIEEDFPVGNTRYEAVEVVPLGEESDEDEKQAVPMYVGFRGDVHDFSSAKEDLKPIPVDLSAVGFDNRKKKEDDTLSIITYDPDKRQYLRIHPLQFGSYTNTENPIQVPLGLERKILHHFMQLKPNEVQHIHRCTEPDELNSEAIYEVLADPGLGRDPHIYDTSIINERETLWSILIDISGSTGSSISKEKRVIDVEKECAALLYKSLTTIGDRVNLYAFSSDDHETTLYNVKTSRNLSALQPENANADGVAIRGVIAKMLPIAAKEKNLIVISDGKPCAYNYQGRYAIEDTSMAFFEAENRDIRTIYLNVDRQAAKYFPILTRHVTFGQSFRRVEDLPRGAADLVRRL